MSLFQYLEYQPIDPQYDVSIGELEQYPQEDNFDLTSDPDGDSLLHSWEEITSDMHSAGAN